MAFNDLLDLIARLIVVIGVPVGAIWAFWIKVVVPAKLRAQDETRAADLTASADTREYTQKRDADAFSQTLAINERLVQVLIEISDNKIEDLGERLEAHEKIFYTISQHIGRANTAIETANRERVQMAEQQSDIEIVMNKIETSQQNITNLLVTLIGLLNEDKAEQKNIHPGASG